MLRRILFPISLLLWVAQAQIPKDAASLAAGKKIYEFHCAFCHGKGDDGFAANLVSPNLLRAPSDNALFNIIKNGIPGSDMPASLGMSDADIWKASAYVRSLGRSAPQRIPGDLAKGGATFKAQCSGCHMVGGAGGRMGPDLTDIGAKRSPASLRTSVLDPNASVVPGWGMAKVTLNDGSAVSGVRVNEDQFAIMLREGSGKIHNIDKAKTKSIDRNNKSSMPAYQGKIQGGDLDDLIAYLFSLKGGM